MCHGWLQVFEGFQDSLCRVTILAEVGDGTSKVRVKTLTSVVANASGTTHSVSLRLPQADTGSPSLGSERCCVAVRGKRDAGAKCCSE